MTSETHAKTRIMPATIRAYFFASLIVLGFIGGVIIVIKAGIKQWCTAAMQPVSKPKRTCAQKGDRSVLVKRQ